MRVVTTTAGAPSPVPRERAENGLRITTVPAIEGAGGRKFAFAPAVGREIARGARDVDLCIIEGTWSWPAAVACRVCRRLKVPYVLSPQGTLTAISLSEKTWKKRIYMRLVARADIAAAMAVHFSSAMEMQESRAALGEVPGFVSPNPLTAPPLLPPAGDELRAELGIPASARIVGLAGRINPRKGFHVILPALAACRAPIHLALFGADEEGRLPSLRREIESLGLRDRVHVLGYLEGEALQRAYASLDLLVLPSLGESFGNVVLEALAQGTAVMISDRVPLGDYVRENDLGRVVEGLDPAAWREALDSWAGGTVRFDREGTARRVREDFDPLAIGGRLLGQLEGILLRSRSRGDR